MIDTDAGIIWQADKIAEIVEIRQLPRFDYFSAALAIPAILSRFALSHISSYYHFLKLTTDKHRYH